MSTTPQRESALPWRLGAVRSRQHGLWWLTIYDAHDEEVCLIPYHGHRDDTEHCRAYIDARRIVEGANGVRWKDA